LKCTWHERRRYNEQGIANIGTMKNKKKRGGGQREKGICPKQTHVTSPTNRSGKKIPKKSGKRGGNLWLSLLHNWGRPAGDEPPTFKAVRGVNMTCLTITKVPRQPNETMAKFRFRQRKKTPGGEIKQKKKTTYSSLYYFGGKRSEEMPVGPHQANEMATEASKKRLQWGGGPYQGTCARNSGIRQLAV